MARVKSKLTPDEAKRTFYSLAVDSEGRGRFPDAARYFEAAEAWGNAALCYTRLGDDEKAREMRAKEIQRMAK